MHIKFWLGFLKGRGHLENLSMNERAILKWKHDGRVWTGFICLWIGIGGRLL
jgi:hypothetical protein